MPRGVCTKPVTLIRWHYTERSQRSNQTSNQTPYGSVNERPCSSLDRRILDLEPVGTLHQLDLHVGHLREVVLTIVDALRRADAPHDAVHGLVAGGDLDLIVEVLNALGAVAFLHWKKRHIGVSNFCNGNINMTQKIFRAFAITTYGYLASS